MSQGAWFWRKSTESLSVFLEHVFANFCDKNVDITVILTKSRRQKDEIPSGKKRLLPPFHKNISSHHRHIEQKSSCKDKIEAIKKTTHCNHLIIIITINTQHLK